MKIAIIGGGAAGFFSALSVKQHFPMHEVIILEKTTKVLAKVKVSGGGRCNVTNNQLDSIVLSKHYPRGENYLKKAFDIFNVQDTFNWFEERGVALKVYPDGCVFPLANDSQVIIDCFTREAHRLNVKIEYQAAVQEILIEKDQFILKTRDQSYSFDKVIITTGGQPKRNGLEWLEKLGHTLIDPVPSLFTFNMPGNPIATLMGNVVEKAVVRVEGTKLIARGPLLVTHWGMSGPAILQLSAWGARVLHDKEYQFAILVNWLDEQKEQEVQALISKTIANQGGKMLGNLNPFPLTNRLWHFLVNKCALSLELRWQDLGNKSINKLINTLINDRYEVSGKTTFKEEFVTAGGIALKDIDIRTMESKIVPGLHFAGELLDIDGITGGYNFQAAWTTGFIAGKGVGN
jgi:predicted Rossmann fold flavoprotein